MCQTIFWKEDTVLMQIQFKLPSLFPLTEQFFLLYPSYSPCIWTSIIWTGLFSFPLQGFWVFTIQIMSGESEVTARAATVGRSHREHSEPYCEVKNVCLDVIHVFLRTIRPIYLTLGRVVDTWRAQNGERRQRGSCAIPLTWARGEADVNKLESSAFS